MSRRDLGQEESRPAETTQPKRHRVLKTIGWVVVGLVLALYIGFPFGMALAAVWPSRADVPAPPAGFKTVHLSTSDGVSLSAWYAPSTNGSAVILVHGAGGSRNSVRSLAGELANQGYGVLALDLSGHGESEGSTNRLGWMGTRDMRAAVDYLRATNPDDMRIGAVGYSMGGEALLGASAECPEITAIVTDGATRRSTDELLALPSERSLVRNFTARVMYASVELLSRQAPPRPLQQEMQRSPARFLLIAAGDEPLEIAFNELSSQQLGSRAQLWVAPGVEHTGARARYPDEYDQRITRFLNAELRPSSEADEGTPGSRE